MTQGDMVDDAAWEGRFAAIEKEADAILKAEGPHHVRGAFFVEAGDAHMERMLVAEQIVAKRDESMDRWIATPRKTVEAPCPEMSVVEGISDEELAVRMALHTAKVCDMVTDAMGVKP